MNLDSSHITDQYIDLSNIKFLFTIEKYAKDNPNKIALEMGGVTLSYGDLLSKATKWSVKLSKLIIKEEQPVAILLEPSIDNIVAQLSILYCGGTCVPLDINQPSLRLQRLIDNLNIEVAITREIIGNSVQVKDQLTTNELDLEFNDYDSIPTNFTIVDLEHRTHILHTSGTSGVPKAVEILAKGILRLAFNPSFCPFNSNDTVAHISNPTFDASLFEIYGALLNGCTLHIFAKDTILDVAAFSAGIKEKEISIIAITTSLFNLIAFSKPEAFKGVHSIIVGGEPANAIAMKEVLLNSEVPNLRNGYGPTECTTYATTRHVTLNYLNTHTSIDIGTPINNTEVFIINDNLEVVEIGKIGEIVIAGDGVARSYVNNDKDLRFRTLELNGISYRIYRTGDIGLIDQNGSIHCYGRKDNQIKIRGHRINLEEIEQSILKTGMVSSVVVDIIKSENSNIEPYIMAYIVPKLENLAEGLKNSLAQLLPSYMIPRIYITDHIPLNSNGKADKKALYQLSTSKRSNFNEKGKSQTITKIREIWCKTLNYFDISEDDNFFDLGGSSLQVVTLVINIKQEFSIDISISELYEHQVLNSLAELIENKMNHTDVATFDSILDILKEDGESPLPTINKNFVPINWTSPQEGRVFLTGVTGFLGAFFLELLCKDSDVKEIYCLVRADTPKAGLNRILENQKKYGLWNEESSHKVKVVCGHLDQDYFGLTEEEYKFLSEKISCIFHLGAHVNYIQPYSVHKPANVIGTLNILKFSTHFRMKPLHYTSSIAAFGPTGFFNKVNFLSENEPLDDHLNCLQYDTGYSQSQWVAEKIMVRAQDIGLPINIYRPGFIMGDSKRGIGNEKDFVARFLKGCIEIGAFPKLEHQKKEFISVDYVSECLLKLAKKMTYPQSYNLVPLDPNRSINLIKLHKYLLEYGYALKLVNYNEWVNILKESGNLYTNPLLPLLPMLKEPVYNSMTRWEVYENMPIYDTANVKKALGKDLTSPTLDEKTLHKYLNYWLDSGFIEKRPN